MFDYIKLSLKHVPKMLKALEEYPKARRFLYFVLVSVIASVAIFRLPDIISAFAACQ